MLRPQFFSFSLQTASAGLLMFWLQTEPTGPTLAKEAMAGKGDRPDFNLIYSQNLRSSFFEHNAIETTASAKYPA